MLLFPIAAALAGSLPDGAHFATGGVNSLQLGERLAVYGSAAAVKYVLLTHARRDAIGPVGAAAVIAPERERDLLEHPERFWGPFETARFHDYAQASTKVPVRATAVSRGVRGGEILDLDGAKVTVLATPGYTAGAVSYLVEWHGARVACTGDLIYGDGQLLDLYSLQDAIPEAKTRGYHGYAARAGDLIASLRAVAAWKPDVIVPAHGPLVEDPQSAVSRLVERLQVVLRSHFTTDALRWYWGDENLRLRGGRALDGMMPEWMPMAEQTKLPAWVFPISNSRLIVSSSGAAFLVDAGYSKIIAELEELHAAGRFKSLEGIWITHYHDDHTDNAQSVADHFRCPIYFNTHLRDILEHPGAYRMPCLTTKPIRPEGAREDNSTLRWHEFKLTMQFFPGQTLYHGGLYLERDSGERLYFTGDSFTPSGMDDYCLQNRDFLNAGEGLLYCLDRLATTKPGTWLLNQHVEPMFRFTPQQTALMRAELEHRIAALRELAPWPDANYAVDESWARLYPYGATIARGERLTLSLKVLNHAPRPEEYRVVWHAPPGLRVVRGQGRATIGARKEGVLSAVLEGGAAGLHLVTVDVAFDGRTLPEWTEAMVRVK